MIVDRSSDQAEDPIEILDAARILCCTIITNADTDTNTTRDLDKVTRLVIDCREGLKWEWE